MQTKILLGLIILILSISVFAFNGSGTSNDPWQVTDCAILPDAGYYTLMNSIDSLGSNCFSITASNVNVDGNNKNLTDSIGANSNNGIETANLNSINIHDFNSITLFYDGIKLTNTKQSTINNTINLSNNTYGIELIDSNNNTLQKINGTTGTGSLINLYDSNTNTLNDINSTAYDYQINIQAGSSHNSVSNIIATNSNSSGIKSDTVTSNDFNNITIINSSSQGIYVLATTDSNFSNITMTGTQSNGFDIDSTGGRNTFTNITMHGYIGVGDAIGIWGGDGANEINNLKFYHVSLTGTGGANGLFFFSARHNYFEDINISGFLNDYYIDDSISDSNDNNIINFNIGSYNLSPTVTTNSVLGFGQTNGLIYYINAIGGQGTNLNADLNIIDNNILIDSSTDASLDTNARLKFYGTGILNGVTVLRNGIACGAECSNFVNLGDGNYGVDVNGQGLYSIQATVSSAPLNLVATTVSSSRIDLVWDVPTDNGGSAIIGYKIERESPVGGGWGIIVANTGNTNTDYNNTGLTSGTQYNYRVSAINAIGTSSPSNQANTNTNPSNNPIIPQSSASMLVLTLFITAAGLVTYVIMKIKNNEINMEEIVITIIIVIICLSIAWTMYSIAI